MGIGLIVIEKSYEGETWTNTHAFSTGAPLALDDSDMAEIGWEDMAGAWAAKSAPPGLDAAATMLVGAVLGFERRMHFEPITITKVYVSDGKQADIADPNTYAVASVSLPGLRSLTGGTEDVIAPGTIALQVNRQPAGYSARQGRLQLRGVLMDLHVRFNARGGVSWAGPASQAGFEAYVQSALDECGLPRFFSGGALPVQYCIPHYQRKEDDPAGKGGKLIGATQVADFTVVGPKSRQMTRGRKRKPVTP